MDFNPLIRSHVTAPASGQFNTVKIGWKRYDQVIQMTQSLFPPPVLTGSGSMGLPQKHLSSGQINDPEHPNRILNFNGGSFLFNNTKPPTIEYHLCILSCFSMTRLEALIFMV
jgi:hypothetical protein